VQESGQIIAEALLRAAKREIVPGDRAALELGRFETFVIGAQRAADRRRRVDDDDRRATGVRIDVHEAVDADVEPAFLARLAHGRGEQRLTAIDVPAGEDPFPVARFDRAPDEHEAFRRRRGDANDGADGNLRIEVEDEAALRADEPLRLAGLQPPALEETAASRAKPVRVRIVVRVELEIGHAITVWERDGRLPGIAGPPGIVGPGLSRARGKPRLQPGQYNAAAMSILKVARMGHPVLRTKAPALERAEIKTAAVQRLIDDMIDTMREYHGVGLAAPQVHESVRLFVAALDAREPPPDDADVEPVVLINPEIIVVGTDVVEDWEGCLSIPNIRGRVPRAREIRVRAHDRTGARIEINARDFPARVIQHEADHLDGVLFVDRMESFESLTFLDEYSRYWIRD
jgi:peptide deformylase